MLNRRRLGIAAAVVALVALAVTGALALGGGDDEPRESGATITDQADERAATGETSESETEAQAASETQEEMAPPLTAEEAPPEPEPEPDPAPAPPAEPARYTPYSSSGGDWQAEVPSGGGWQKPVEAGATAGGRIRTTVRGPNGAVLVIDHTPLGPARFGGKDGSRRELTQPWFGSMTEYRPAGDAVGYVLNATESGPGFRVVVTGAERSCRPARRRLPDVRGPLSYDFWVIAQMPNTSSATQTSPAIPATTSHDVRARPVSPSRLPRSTATSNPPNASTIPSVPARL